MKAAFARSPFDFEIRDIEPRKPGADEVLVRVKACGLCGTDLHFARDWQGEYQPLGHEIAAEVQEVGEGNIPYQPGDRVIVEDVAQCGICGYCKSGKPQLCRNMYDLGGQPGMAEMMTVNYHLLEPFDGIEWTHASLVEPMAVAYNTVLNGQIPLGGSVVVTGPGPIGLMCVYLAKMRGAGKVLLVVTQNSKFKRSVVSGIYDELNQNSIYLKIIDVKELKNQSTTEFSAIVIINMCMAGRPDPRVESFIDREAQKNKIIVLTTGILDSWKPDAPGVDAITSASVLEKSDQIARSIANKVLLLVNSK